MKLIQAQCTYSYQQQRFNSKGSTAKVQLQRFNSKGSTANVQLQTFNCKGSTAKRSTADVTINVVFSIRSLSIKYRIAAIHCQSSTVPHLSIKSLIKCRRTLRNRRNPEIKYHRNQVQQATYSEQRGRNSSTHNSGLLSLNNIVIITVSHSL